MRFPRLPLKQLLRIFQRRPDQPSNMTSVQLADMRKPYVSGTLLEKDLPTRDPIELFESWFNEVKDAGSMFEPNAVTLATTTKSGLPSSRMVLLKGFGKDGFVFFTNYESRKGRELVRIEGTVERVSEEVSERYFHSRPRLTQLAAVASTQSAPLESRAALEAKFKALEEEYKDSSKEIPKPSWWGGYCLVPSRMEFWQGHSSRLHDRIVFRKGSPSGVAQLAAPGWVMERLYP
ncbi:pyridoxine/pyridoxamine 5'-phosphate oxidase-like isoform X2 [Dermacentor albipictus]|uniref:pyridoxine/pyridoxamine 5'-phosphate oxidase-like isoform X2 n=1 Tax=Dermacentor albipictus TaxID=60249 RepID=UPI0031FBD0F8